MSAVNQAGIGFRLNEMMGELVFLFLLIPFFSIGQKHCWGDQPCGQYFRNPGVDILGGNKNFCIIAPDSSTSLLNSECPGIVQRLWMMRKSSDSLLLRTSVFSFSFEEGELVSSLSPDRLLGTGFHSTNELFFFCGASAIRSFRNAAVAFSYRLQRKHRCPIAAWCGQGKPSGKLVVAVQQLYWEFGWCAPVWRILSGEKG